MAKHYIRVVLGENRVAFTKVQEAAIRLIKKDLQYMYTIVKKYKDIPSNYIVFLMPYTGIVIDGVEDWLKSYNNSHKEKLAIPLFSTEEQKYYEEMRSSIKLWNNSYDDIFAKLEVVYCESDKYFAGLCKPIARKFKLYDIYGTDLANGKFCGNTILCSYYIPTYSCGSDIGEYLENMGIIGGKYISLFNSMKEYPIDENIKFEMCDFGGFRKSPLGNDFNDKFVLFSILCQINFILYCVDKYIVPEIPVKLRFSYLLYYYLLRIIPEVNERMKSDFLLCNNWDSQLFRNAMAHYKLGVSLKDNDIDENDMMYGLTHKIWGLGYEKIKINIILQLTNLANQIERYLEM